MAVPNTTTFSLNDVRIEIGLPSNTSLQTCFDNANSSGFNPSYSGSKNSLLNFRDYSHGITTFPISLGYHNSTPALACSDYSSSPSIYYGDGTNLYTTVNLYSTSDGTILAPVGYYSEGVVRRYWNGSTLGSAVAC